MSDKAVTHQFKDCTIDLRGAGYACVSRGDEFEIGHTGEGDRVLIDGDTLDFTGLHILGPVALADRIKAAVALECYAMATDRDALRGELARLTAERDTAQSDAEALARKCAVADALVEAAGCWLNIAAHCAIEDGSCCCGDDMKNHPSPMNCGHTPVDHGSYVAAHAIKTTEVALAAWVAAQADYEASILAAIQPDPDARQADLAKAWMMGRDSAAAIPADHAEYARKRLGATTHPQYASDWSIIVSRCDMIVDAIRALLPPADLAAKIGGE